MGAMRIIPKMKNQPQNVLFIQNFGPVKQAELELKSINMPPRDQLRTLFVPSTYQQRAVNIY